MASGHFRSEIRRLGGRTKLVMASSDDRNGRGTGATQPLVHPAHIAHSSAPSLPVGRFTRQALDVVSAEVKCSYVST